MAEARMDESNQSHERKAAWSLVETNVGDRFDPFGDSKPIVSEARGPNTPSTASLSSLSHGEYLDTPDSAKKGLPHVRTNFTNQSYMPPIPTVSPNTHSTRLTAPPVLSRRQAAWDDDEEEMPFDQMGKSVPVPQQPIPPVQTDLPFDEAPDDEIAMIVTPDARRNVQALRAYYGDTDRFQTNNRVAPAENQTNKHVSPLREEQINRFQTNNHVSPLRPEIRGLIPLSPQYSEATNRFHSHEDEEQSEFLPDPLDEAKEKYEEFGLSPGSTTDNSAPTTAEFSFMEEVPKEFPKVDKASDGDDDSIFDFEADRKRKKLAAVKDRRRARRNQRMEDDNSSIEPDVSLQERAQQAFLTRNRKLVKEPVTPKRPIQEWRGRSPGSPNVSFDKNIATVQYYVTEEEDEEEEEEEDETVVSEADRTMFSEYTKSMESEVEDLFKDLFFIGSGKSSKPGRRATKDQPAKKREEKKAKQARQDDDSWLTDDGSALETLDEDSVLDETTNFTGQTFSTLNGENLSLESTSVASRSRSVSPIKRSSRQSDNSSKGSAASSVASEEDIPDPLTAMWQFMEGGVSAMGAALGIAPTQCSPTIEDATQSVALARYTTEHNTDAIQTMKKNVVEPKSSTSDGRNSPPRGRNSPIQSALEFANELLLGPNGEIAALNKEDDVEENKSPLTALENDPRLAELALYTARSVHEIQGLVLDESADVELVTQLEFHVVKIGLPLGILFQENGGGCWVAKVFPDGNAAKQTQSEGVRVADQLAAIDGRSSIKMKVDDICSLISEAENTQSIELTFLRYTGPLRPVDTPDSEGYAITDASGTDVEDTDERRTDINTTEMNSKPLDEQLFDNAYRAMRPPRGSEKNAALNKSKRTTKTRDGKKRFRLFGRKAKTAKI